MRDIRQLEPALEPEPEPESEPQANEEKLETADAEDDTLFRLPSRNTLRNERIAALERRAAAK